jgi:hypothetical protein
MNNIIVPAKNLILPTPGLAVLPAPDGNGIYAKWELEVRDGDKVVDRREGAVHSFVKNFGRSFLAMFDLATNVNPTLTDRTGASFQPRFKSTQSITFDTLAVFGGVPQIGFANSAAALDSNQFELQGTILTGLANATQSLIVEDNVQTQFKVEGQVSNAGGSFTVEEMGLYAIYRDYAGTLRTTLTLRDLTGSVVVGTGLTILGRWTFTLAV